MIIGFEQEDKKKGRPNPDRVLITSCHALNRWLCLAAKLRRKKKHKKPTFETVEKMEKNILK